MQVLERAVKGSSRFSPTVQAVLPDVQAVVAWTGVADRAQSMSSWIWGGGGPGHS